MSATWLIFRRHLRQTTRTKIGVLLGALQPLLYLLFFGPLLDELGSGSWRLVVPGLLIQLVLFSAGLAGFGIVFDHQFGVLDRLRTTPVSRLALLLGRVLRDVVVLLVQAVLIILVGAALGLRAPIPGVLLGLLLLVPLAAGVAAASYAVALLPGATELFAPVMTTVVIPLVLLSGAFLPMTLGPRWLDLLSRLDPFRYAVDALRDLFAGQYLTVPVLLGAAVTLVLAAATTALGVRAFERDAI
ncbi:ABC transporter permease [Cryptosporangium aurantiacum]|uniref:Transport permease protein n=1 Tax=Cryptosporangium aurantiacum TaxID=134849 RepID=A0A1M7QRW1_9ACTN|nr:ABC transporter permease [Cryptosporangium aurantiacum]SHN34280.1 ABC-2 type transport system permease protein [Cryptosporangium aurantiacum]